MFNAYRTNNKMEPIDHPNGVSRVSFRLTPLDQTQIEEETLWEPQLSDELAKQFFKEQKETPEGMLQTTRLYLNSQYTMYVKQFRSLTTLEDYERVIPAWLFLFPLAVQQEWLRARADAQQWLSTEEYAALDRIATAEGATVFVSSVELFDKWKHVPLFTRAELTEVYTNEYRYQCLLAAFETYEKWLQQDELNEMTAQMAQVKALVAQVIQSQFATYRADFYETMMGNVKLDPLADEFRLFVTESLKDQGTDPLYAPEGTKPVPSAQYAQFPHLVWPVYQLLDDGVNTDLRDLMQTYLPPPQILVPTLYERLGLTPEATANDIKMAYRNLALRLHTDKGGKTELFQALTEAHTILSKEDYRKKYDEFGHNLEKTQAYIAQQQQQETYEELLSAGDVVDTVQDKPPLYRLASFVAGRATNLEEIAKKHNLPAETPLFDVDVFVSFWTHAKRQQNLPDTQGYVQRVALLLRLLLNRLWTTILESPPQEAEEIERQQRETGFRIRALTLQPVRFAYAVDVEGFQRTFEMKVHLNRPRNSLPPQTNPMWWEEAPAFLDWYFSNPSYEELVLLFPGLTHIFLLTDDNAKHGSREVLLKELAFNLLPFLYSYLQDVADDDLASSDEDPTTSTTLAQFTAALFRVTTLTSDEDPATLLAQFTAALFTVTTLKAEQDAATPEFLQQGLVVQHALFKDLQTALRGRDHVRALHRYVQLRRLLTRMRVVRAAAQGPSRVAAPRASRVADQGPSRASRASRMAKRSREQFVEREEALNKKMQWLRVPLASLVSPRFPIKTETDPPQVGQDVYLTDLQRLPGIQRVEEWQGVFSVCTREYEQMRNLVQIRKRTQWIPLIELNQYVRLGLLAVYGSLTQRTQTSAPAQEATRQYLQSLTEAERPHLTEAQHHTFWNTVLAEVKQGDADAVRASYATFAREVERTGKQLPELEVPSALEKTQRVLLRWSDRALRSPADVTEGVQALGQQLESLRAYFTQPSTLRDVWKQLEQSESANLREFATEQQKVYDGWFPESGEIQRLGELFRAAFLTQGTWEEQVRTLVYQWTSLRILQQQVLQTRLHYMSTYPIPFSEDLRRQFQSALRGGARAAHMWMGLGLDVCMRKPLAAASSRGDGGALATLKSWFTWS